MKVHVPFRRNGGGLSLTCVAALLSAVLLSNTVKITAQVAAPGPADNLTVALLAMHKQYQAASPDARKALDPQFIKLASQRQQMLGSLIQTDPAEVLRVVIPNEVSARMPASVQSLVEKKIQTQGTLEVTVEDGKSSAKLHHYVKTSTGRLELKFAGHAPTNLLTGASVKVQGVQVGNTLALTSGSGPSSDLQVVSSGLTNTFGAQSTLVMLVNFEDNTSQPFGISDVTNAIFGSANSATNWDLENSLQQTWLTGTVVGWYTMPLTAASCPDNNTIATDANAAATAAGVNLSNYAHYMYAFPFLSTCYGWLGLATVGGVPGESWINGEPTLKLVTHEMGHNFGLYHSHSSTCGNTLTLCASPTINEYGDPIDTMGNPSYGHFNAFQKERLGWLNYGSSPPITQVQSNGTYTIGPYENQDETPKALKILQSTDPTTGANTWYYVQYSQAVGFDSFLSNDSNVLGGVLIHTGTDNDGNSNNLLNLAPSLNNIYYSALDAGQTFIDPTAGITLQTVSTNANGASIGVTFGTPSCQHFNPTISISPGQSQTVAAGTAVAYTISLLNNDNAGCSASTFNLSGAVPPGWSASLANPSLTLAYGTTASTTIQVLSPSGAPTGTYSFTVRGTNAAASTFTASIGAAYNLNTAPCAHTNPTVTFSPATQSVQPGSTALYVLGVTNNDNASCNSSTFTLGGSVPTGWSASFGISALTIAAGGTASTSLQVTSPAATPAGSYSVGGSATSNTSSSYLGSATASYVALGASCTRANPTVTVTPSQSQTVAAGTPVAFTVNVTDHDSSACTSATFNLNASLQSGWLGSWSASSLVLSSGANGSAVLTVTSPSSAAAGSYSVAMTATDASATSYYGAASTTYVASAASSSSSTSISTNSSSYLPGQSVGITVTMSSGGKPQAGAPVSVSVIAPNGSTNNLSGTTGSSGTVTLVYKLKKQAPAGIYQAQVGNGSSLNAASTIPVSTTFAVQ